MTAHLTAHLTAKSPISNTVNITSVALTFCIIPLFIFLCLVTPARATPLPTSPLQTSQITPQRKGISTYQKNLDRLRTSQTSPAPQPAAPQPTAPQPIMPKIAPEATSLDKPLQQPSLESSVKQPTKEQLPTNTTEIQQQSQRESQQQGQQPTHHNRVLQRTNPYAIIKAAQQPHLSQTRQTRQTSSNRIDSASLVTMVKQTIQDILSPIGDHIQSIQASLKSALIRLLEQVETKAHQIANQLSEP